MVSKQVSGQNTPITFSSGGTFDIDTGVIHIVELGPGIYLSFRALG